jgi:transcription elongation factor SPT6
MKLPQVSLANISSSAWDEIHDVFGDGHEYDWALEADDEVQYDEDNLKPEMKYQDVSAITPRPSHLC